MSPLWRDGNFRRVWTGQTASIFGDRVTDIALPWLILVQTRSPFAAGVIAAARYAPMVLLGVFAGVAADRVPRRGVLIACDALRTLALGAVVALALAGRVAPLWLLAVVVVCLGIGQLGFQATYWAWLPDVTGEAQYGRATAALEAADAVSTLTGPALGGALIQVIGPALALGADALSYVTSAVSLAAVRPPAPPPMSERAAVSWNGLWHEVSVGARTILTSPAQRLLKGFGTVLYLSSGTITVLLAVLTQTRLHLPAWQAGFIYAAAGAGGLIGSTLAPRLLQRAWPHALAATFAGATLGMAGLALACELRGGIAFAVALAANLILDGCVALSFIITGTTSTLITPREVRGRVNATSTLYSAAVRGVGLLLAGALAANGNPLPAFAALGAAFALASAAGVTRRRTPGSLSIDVLAESGADEIGG
jgi:MFS family permease